MLKPCHLHQLVFLVSCRDLNTHVVPMMLKRGPRQFDWAISSTCCMPEHAALTHTQHKAFALDQACLAAWQEKKAAILQ